MKRSVLVLGLVGTLSACGDGQPFFDDGQNGGGGGGGGGGGPAQPLLAEDTMGNLQSARFVPPSGGDDGRLLVEIDALDSTPRQVAFRRNEDLDVPGYVAYSLQEDPLDRFFTGMAASSRDGSIQGSVVADGGQFNTYFGGATVRRSEPYSPYEPSQPNRGLVSYAGDYVGLSNISVPRPNETLPVPPGTPPALIPGQASRVTGDIFLNADFTDNRVNGAITDREMQEWGIALPDVVLVPSEITGRGNFAGSAQDRGLNDIGTYSGAFGGDGATAVAGGVLLEGYLDAFENEQERGLFVLTRCGLPGDARICDDVNPRRP